MIQKNRFSFPHPGVQMSDIKFFNEMKGPLYLKISDTDGIIEIPNLYGTKLQSLDLPDILKTIQQLNPGKSITEGAKELIWRMIVWSIFRDEPRDHRRVAWRQVRNASSGL